MHGQGPSTEYPQHVFSWRNKKNMFYFLLLGPWYVCLLKHHLFLKVIGVCVEVLRPSQPNGVMSSAVSLPNTRLLGRLSPLSS